MQTTQIVYKGRKPIKTEIAELMALVPFLDVNWTKLADKTPLVTEYDYFYDVLRLDWKWLRSLFKPGNDIDCLVLLPGELSDIGVKKHWGFYSLDGDKDHQFYMTNLGRGELDYRAKANGFKSNFVWMFVHELLHGKVWGETRDKEKAAVIVHEWEQNGELKIRMEWYVRQYQLLEIDVTQKTAKVVELKRMKTLQVFRPLISSKITQPWGVNEACVRTDGKGAIVNARNGVCPAGMMSFYNYVGLRGHNGIDIGAFVGEDVYHAATFDGWMTTETDNRGGIGVDVVSNEPLFFKGVPPREIRDTAVLVDGGYTHHIKMRYWHLKSPVGHDGKQVTCGTTIGLAGNTGASSGPHLHFAPKWCMADGRSVSNDNGYFGAFDQTPYYNNAVTAKDHSNLLIKTRIEPTAQELKNMESQLSTLQKMLVELLKIKHSI
jgi:hypothetical protein